LISQLCRTTIPSNVECPKCKKPVGLQPAVLLGCVSGDCVARMWNYICCPSCDYTWTFSFQPPQAGVTASVFPDDRSRPSVSGPLSPNTQAAPASEEDPWKLNRLLANWISSAVTSSVCRPRLSLMRIIDFLVDPSCIAPDPQELISNPFS